MSQFSAQTRFQRHVLPVLRRHGKEIGVRSQEGDENCASIIHLYMMLYRICDSITLVLLEEAIRKAGYSLPERLED